MQWFRFYAEALNDDKVQKLNPEHFKIWVNCLCLASSSAASDGKLGAIPSIAFALRETEDAVSCAFHALVNVGVLLTDGETFHMKNWKKRQYKSDTSTDRVKQHRKRYRNVTETHQSRAETDTDKTREARGFLDQRLVVGSVGGSSNFSMPFLPTPDTAQRLRDTCPGWDQHFLMKAYGEWSNGQERPRNPQAAFLGWAKSFTKGKAPAC